jgi:hypothetical protein
MITPSRMISTINEAPKIIPCVSPDSKTGPFFLGWVSGGGVGVEEPFSPWESTAEGLTSTAADARRTRTIKNIRYCWDLGIIPHGDRFFEDDQNSPSIIHHQPAPGLFSHQKPVIYWKGGLV